MTYYKCSACLCEKDSHCFSGAQLRKYEDRKCQSCVEEFLHMKTLSREKNTVLKQCAQCFQHLLKVEYSIRQYSQVQGKCKSCVFKLLESESIASEHSIGKWSYNCYYRACHRGKKYGGVPVRAKRNVSSPIIAIIPIGRVFNASDVIYNEQGDPIVKIPKLASFMDMSISKLSSTSLETAGWVPFRSMHNEVLLESHIGPWEQTINSPKSFYRCVIEGCKARKRPCLDLPEIGYILYGNVVEVTEAHYCEVTGVVFLKLHERYFQGSAWVVERTLDNESVLNSVEGPSLKVQRYRCVQESGAPIRTEPVLSSLPIGRISCGTVVTALERIVNADRQIFLRLATCKCYTKSEYISSGDINCEKLCSDVDPVWVIETTTCCSTVMSKVNAHNPKA